MEIPKYIGPYEVMFPLGSGGSAVVYQVYDRKTQKYYAAKFISRKSLTNKINLEHFESELRIFERIRHPNIAQWHQTIYTEDYIIVVMELLVQGTLYNALFIGSFDEKAKLRIAYEVLQGLNYLHSNNISHLDIKPDNIGFDISQRAKILDFGLTAESKYYLTRPCGTPLYCAPEMLYEENFDGMKADIWSLGVTLHVFAVKQYPFAFTTQDEYLDKVTKIGKYIKNKAMGYMGYLIQQCLHPDPNLRPSAKELLACPIFNAREILPDEGNMRKPIIIRRRTIIKHSFVRKSVERRPPSIIIPFERPTRSLSNSNIHHYDMESNAN